MIQTWRQESRRQRRPWTISGSLMLAGGLGILLVGLLFPPPPDLVWLPAALAFAGLFIAMVSGVIKGATGVKFPLTEVQRQIKAQIEGRDDSAAVSLLLASIDAHPFRPVDPLTECMLATLTRLLSKMSERETIAPLRFHIGKLVNLLNNNMATSHPDLVIAILRLLPALAERDMLVPTARLISADAPTRNEQHVREAAREVLPKLLDCVDMGGQETLPEWIGQMPMIGQDQNRLTSSQLILPFLAIMKLLPQTTPDDFLRLSQKARHRLYANLLHVPMLRLEDQYILVVLNMIYQSADVEAFAVMRQLLDGNYVSPYPQVREAARACEEVLKAQIEKENVSKTLLRGASAPEAAPETLLRAASGNTAADPQLLLRANVKESEAEPATATDRHAFVVRPAAAEALKENGTVRLSGGK